MEVNRFNVNRKFIVWIKGEMLNRRGGKEGDEETQEVRGRELRIFFLLTMVETLMLNSQRWKRPNPE